MRKFMIVLAAVFLLFSSLAFADMMDWNWGTGGMMGWGPGMMGWWPFGVGWGAFGVFVAILWILAFIFWIWMLVDAVTRRFDDNIEKLVWVLVIIFANIIGALIYYFIIKASNRSSAVMRRPMSKK